MKVSAVCNGQIGTKPGETCRAGRGNRQCLQLTGKQPCHVLLLYCMILVIWKGRSKQNILPLMKPRNCDSLPLPSSSSSLGCRLDGPVHHCSLSKHVGSKSSKIRQSEARMQSGLCLGRRTSYFSESVRRFIFLRHYRCWVVQAAVPEAS